jgi:transposase
VGVDLGIDHTMTLSDGTRIGNPRYTAKYEERLADDFKDFSKTLDLDRYARRNENFVLVVKFRAAHHGISRAEPLAS